MKKNKLFAAFAAISILFAGCGDKAGSDDAQKGNEGVLKVSFDFSKSPVTAAKSTAIPITQWSNIKSLMLVLTQGSGAAEIIKDARAISGSEIPTATGVDNTKLFSGVEVGTYNVYLIANADPSVAAGPYLGSIVDKGLASDAAWSQGTLKGKLMADFAVALKPHTNGVAINFDSPREIFLAKGIAAIVADNTTPVSLSLERIVSLVRVRVSLEDGDNNSTGNRDVNLMNIESELQLGRIQKSFNIVSGISATPNITDYIYSKGAFKDADPTAGYSPLIIKSGDFAHWKELIILPTTSDPAAPAKAPSNKKLFVKISGWVPAGYKFADNSPTNPSVAGPGGALAYWGANVDVWFKANQITDVNCTLTSSGKKDGGDVVPTEEGNMNITIDLQDWNSNIQETNVEM